MGKKKKQQIEKVEETSVETPEEEISAKKEQPVEEPVEDKKKKKKKKHEEKIEEINNLINENNNSDNSSNENILKEEVKEEPKNVNINDDLYAPFGDKTFNKDELLNTGQSVTFEESNDTIETNNSINDNIDIDRIKNDNEYINHLDDSIIMEHLKQKKTPEEQNKFDVEMMKTYIGSNYASYMNNGFNIKAAIFGSLYLLYRKLYIYGISMFLFVLAFISFFIINFNIIGLIVVIAITLGLHILIGLKFNRLYINTSYNQVKKLENIYNANRDEYVLSQCKLAGGTNTVRTVIISLVISVIVIFSIIQISNLIK